MTDTPQDRPQPGDRQPGDERTVEDILTIVAKETSIGRDRLQPTARIDELGIASIDLVHAIFALETRFDIEIPVLAPQSGAEFAVVGDLVDHVLATVKAARKVAPEGAGG